MRVSRAWFLVLVACSHNKPSTAPSAAGSAKAQQAPAGALSPMAALAAEAAASPAAPRSAGRRKAKAKISLSDAKKSDAPSAMDAPGDAPGGAAASEPAPPPPPPEAPWECFERDFFAGDETNERFTRQRLVGETLEVDTVLGGQQTMVARLHFARADDGLRTSWRGFSMEASLDTPDATAVSITLTFKNGQQARERRTIEGDVLTLVGVASESRPYEIVLRMRRRECDSIAHVFAESESVFYSADHPEAPDDD